MKRIRLAGRLTLAVVALTFVALVGVQFFTLIVRNVAVAHEVAASRDDLARLQARKIAQLRTIRRLNDPRGAVPEIHDKLRLVGPHEELIFIEGGPSPSPEPETGI